MSASRPNALDQLLDIKGSRSPSDSLTGADEASGLGAVVPGQTGAAASIGAKSGNLVTISGLTGMTAASVQRFLTLSGATTAANNGTFRIAAYISATSVQVINANALSPDLSSGAISWKERYAYSLEDDLNYVRTDRKNIKGTAGYSDAVPTYERPTAVGTAVPKNLTNLVSLDSKAVVVPRVFLGATAASGAAFLTVTSTGNLKHATAADRTGVPVDSGIESLDARYVALVDPATESELEVLTGADKGKRVFGLARAGSAVSPDAFEVEFRAVAKGAALSTSVAYTWEAGQPTTVTLTYGYRQRLDQLDDTALRVVMTNGLGADADLSQDIKDVRAALGVADDTTDLASTLTNTGSAFPFFNLPDATPTVVDALNALNGQVGNRTYTGGILTTGQTVAASIQALSNAIEASSIIRTIERVAADKPANVAYTLPGGISYTVDGTGNGRNMYVFVRGLLWDPGTVENGDHYAETSSTQITPYQAILAGDHVSYFILQ